MIFLMIVPSIMIVAIILVHEAAKYFDVKISYISLAICAALSFAVAFVAAEFSTAAGREYFINLFALIFVAAAVVTAINSYLEVKK